MSPEKLTTEEKRTLVYQKAFEYMSEKIEQRVPAAGKFMKFSIALKDPGDQKTCLITIDYDYSDPRQNRLLSMGCIFPDTDMVCSNLVFAGTKEEILAWLQDPASIEEARQVYCDLRNRCDRE